MSAIFQTIPTMDPSESAFVLTIDDNLVLPSNVPAVGTRWIDWELGQKHRKIDTEWNEYVYVDSREASPGQRSFVFGKSKTAQELLTPFESYFDNEFYTWPEVVTSLLSYSVMSVIGGFALSSTSSAQRTGYSVKSAAEVESMIKIERFQNATPWPESALRHRRPIAGDITIGSTLIRNCLHGRIVVPAVSYSGFNATVNIDPATASPMGLEYPATNFTDWAHFVLRDGQKQINGMWVREKVTIYPPVISNAKVRKVFTA